jgi:hypothetical protein
MDNKEYPKVRREAERQGWHIRPTRRGEMLLAPDGVTSVQWHHTPSDHRALNNTVAKMRKAGFEYPARKARR